MLSENWNSGKLFKLTTPQLCTYFQSQKSCKNYLFLKQPRSNNKKLIQQKNEKLRKKSFFPFPNKITCLCWPQNFCLDVTTMTTTRTTATTTTTMMTTTTRTTATTMMATTTTTTTTAAIFQVAFSSLLFGHQFFSKFGGKGKKRDIATYLKLQCKIDSSELTTDLFWFIANLNCSLTTGQPGFDSYCQYSNKQ